MALENPWKRIWCLKVLEFSIGRPWKSLNSKMVSNPHVKNAVIRRTVSSIVNISVTYWLDAIKAVLHAEDRGGKDLEKVARVLENPWKVLRVISPEKVARLTVSTDSQLWSLSSSYVKGCQQSAAET